MSFDQISYGIRIRKLRASAGLTQEQLAEQIHISRTYLVKIESGSQVGSIELTVELAKFFSVSVDFLLLGQEPWRIDKVQGLQEVISFLAELATELSDASLQEKA